MSTTGTTNLQGKFYISDAPRNEDAELSDYQAATWVQLPNIGNVGDTGVDQETSSYSTWDRPVLAKGKGEADAGNPEVECLDVPSPGMTAMLAASAVSNQDNYMFKLVWADGSVEFNRGLVLGPRLPKGANNEFKRAVFTLGLQQEPVFDSETV